MAATDTLTDSDKHSLLNFLQLSHGTAPAERKKITLVKKSTSEIKQADSTGKARTIQVEVRKKRTFVRREDEVAAEVVAPVAAEPAQDHGFGAPAGGLPDIFMVLQESTFNPATLRPG